MDTIFAINAYAFNMPRLDAYCAPKRRTHKQALSAIVFSYCAVLGVQLPWLDAVLRPTRPRRIPSVLTVAEVAALLTH